MRGKEKRDTHSGGGGYGSRRDGQDEGYRYCHFNDSMLHEHLLSLLNKFSYACLRFLLNDKKL